MKSVNCPTFKDRIGKEMKDIENLTDIKTFVDGFYGKIRADELLASVFALRIAATEWDKHLHRMYNFWNAVLFGQRTYKGNPFAKHATLPVSAEHFSRWVMLFKATIDEHFQGQVAEETKDRVERMALMFQSKLSYLKLGNDFSPLV